MSQRNGLTIGDLADRTGLAVSAIRFYETKGLVHPLRNAGNQRRYDRADIRRLSFIMIAQQMGFPLARIGELLQDLPPHKAPTKADWARMSASLRAELGNRIATLTAQRDKLDGCIGCGCLSLDNCHLYNPADVAQRFGPGPRYLMGDAAPAD